MLQDDLQSLNVTSDWKIEFLMSFFARVVKEKVKIQL